MKKKYIFVEFTIVLFLLILPPLFSKPVETSTTIAFNSASIIQLLIAAALEFQFIYLSEKNKTVSRTFTSNIFLSLKTLLLLGISATLMAGLNNLFPNIFTTNQVNIAVGHTPKDIALYIFQIIVAAFYEEELYRQFLPETLLYLFNTKSKKNCIIIEFTAILIFALSHKYLGIAGVINAIISGAILRLYCRKRTSSIYSSFTAHVFYNTILLIISITNA